MPRETAAVVLARTAAASLVLAPGMIGARIAGAVTRARVELDLATDALRDLGITERPLSIEPLGGGRSNATYRLRFARRTLVLKCALASGTLLAMAARWVGPNPPCSDLSASARIAREARALTTLVAAGVRAPTVIAVAPRRGLLLVEYVDGETLPRTLAHPGALSRIAGYARAICAAHAAGITLGDAHPGNAIVSSGGITLIDLEFAEHGESPSRRAFDLAFAAAFFTGIERDVFVDACGGVCERAVADLEGYAPLFAYERLRQRRAS
jgi:Kae1-associated kinase Bud32